MSGQEEIFTVGQPPDRGDGRRIDDTIFIDTSILLRNRLVPDNVGGGEAQDDIQMGGAFGERVYVMT